MVRCCTYIKHISSSSHLSAIRVSFVLRALGVLDSVELEVVRTMFGGDLMGVYERHGARTTRASARSLADATLSFLSSSNLLLCYIIPL